MSLFSKIFRGRPIASLEPVVREINELEPEIQKLSDAELKSESLKLKERARGGEPIDAILPRAFALVRETAWRSLKQRPFDVQLMGGMVLHRGAVAEMMTGEGKTLAAVAPVYLNALEGKGAHVVTVNEYLARRDAVWMGQIYRALGLTVGCLVPNAAFVYDPEYVAAKEEHAKGSDNPEGSKLLDRERDTTGSFMVQQEFLRPVPRRQAYEADVTYGTNHEFGFDYLRDNLAYSLEGQVQRERHFAIIDEVDSILIDEARTPLIIAAPDAQSSDFYKVFARLVRNLKQEEDFTIDEKRRAAAINESGIEKIENMLGLKDLYGPENLRLVHFLEESLRAHAIYHRDKDYVVKNGEIIIVDEFTGRLLQGRRYQGGLHQAIEAKEGVPIKEESRTYAKISIQNYFRLYKKVSGMTGTAQTSAEEFHKTYNLEVVSIPPNRPLARDDMNDLIYKDLSAKYKAVVQEVAERHKKGQPVLLGTASIEKNELLSALLNQAHIPHEMLNAKNNEREGAIIAQAGRPGAVTVATNVAGRGVDILLGGNPPTPEEAGKVRALGGLHVIGTERHDARRIDNQLRGRAGRQGDPGSSQFFLSLEDDLLRIFGGDRIKGLMERFNLPEDEPIQLGFVSKAVAEAQAKVEGANFDMRKHLLEYDDVLNKQRAAVYKRRQEILGFLKKEVVAEQLFEFAKNHLGGLAQGLTGNPDNQYLTEEEEGEIKKAFIEAGIAAKDFAWPERVPFADFEEMLKKKSAEAAETGDAPQKLLGILDMLWMTHLEDLEALSESVGIRAYGQKDPLVEYRQDASRLYRSFWSNFNAWVFVNMFKQTALGGQAARPAIVQNNTAQNFGKVGRNDPCPCGSGKKYKKCHGK